MLAAAGHLDDVKLTNTRFTLRENKRKIIQNYFQRRFLDSGQLSVALTVLMFSTSIKTSVPLLPFSLVL